MKPLKSIKSKLLAIKTTPSKVSGGYALGVFLGTTPFIGAKVFIALGLTAVFRWSKAASVVGVYQINVLTAPLFYSFAFGIGKWISGSDTTLAMPEKMNAAWVFSTLYGNWDFLKSLLIGGLILGIPKALMAYFLCYVFLIKAKKVECI